MASAEEYWKVSSGSVIDHLFPNSHGGSFARLFDCYMRTEVNRMLIRPWFIGMLIGVSVHQITQKIWNLHVSILDSFLDPLLFMPILLHLILWEQRFLLGKGLLYVLSWTQIIAILILISIFCEYLFPRWSDDFTMDYWDVLCYSIGALFYGSFLNLPLKSEMPLSVDLDKHSDRNHND